VVAIKPSDRQATVKLCFMGKSPWLIVSHYDGSISGPVTITSLCCVGNVRKRVWTQVRG
jgi:hypothetical protein